MSEVDIHVSGLNIRPDKYIFDQIKKKIDMVEFLETEIGCDMKWIKAGVSARTICPMPNHREALPSFNVNFMEDSGIWIYHCFGCGAKGTIIDFCRDYYDLANNDEALVYLCNMFGFKSNKELVISGLQEIQKKTDLKKKREYANIVASNQGRTLLRNDYDNNKDFVMNMYQELNTALDSGDMGKIDELSYSAFDRMGGQNG